MKTIETEGDYLSQYHLDEVQYSMTLEEIRDMERKIENALGCRGWKDYKDYLLAKEMMKQGYLAAFTKFTKAPAIADQR